MIVLALGNPLRGDDGIGIAVINALEADPRLPPGVDLIDGGTPGVDTSLLLQGYHRAIIVDAAEMGLLPGTWAQFALNNNDLLKPNDADQLISAHSAGLVEALELGYTLGILPNDITIFGIQPSTIGWSSGLSNPVQEAIPAVCSAILEILNRVEGSP
jgi:hydrogenase maturation protease